MVAAAALMLSHGAAGQGRLPHVFAAPSTQQPAARGYLGVEVADVDAAKAQALRLKDARGAVVTMIDHDAPAGQAGLRVNDVVVQLNGQAVENAAQLKQMLREMAAGAKVALAIVRDGAAQTVNTELVDRGQMEKSAWNKLGTSGSTAPTMGFMGGNTGPGGFHLPSFGSTLRVGAVVEPLTQQMAAHLGVANGLMVKQVERSSSAEKAGLEALDVILKVGAETVATTADWERAVRANEGKQVQVTILRDGKQQTVTLEVGAKHHQGEVSTPDPETIS
jgi:S1-C subfamily serine protease